MIVRKTQPSVKPETSAELLNAAEHLFAERGVENVALTEIVIAACQRNRSAVHYHFGSRDGVLAAVLNRRLESINARREAALDALPYRPSVAQIVRASMVALAEVIEREPWGADYVAILAQILLHPNLPSRRQPMEIPWLSGMRRAQRLVGQAAPGIPSEIIGQRLNWVADTVIFAFARWTRETPPAARTRASLDALVDQLTAYGAAALAAPPL